MFNKGKDQETDLQPGVELTQSANVVDPMAKLSSAPSIISDDLQITGTVVADGEIQLDGQIEGDVRAGALTVGEKASIRGEIVAEQITVRGRVMGSVRGRQVTLASTARIEGDITHSALSVESGAFFEGHCRHDADPVAGGREISPINVSSPKTGGGDNGEKVAAPFGATPSPFKAR